MATVYRPRLSYVFVDLCCSLPHFKLIKKRQLPQQRANKSYLPIRSPLLVSSLFLVNKKIHFVFLFSILYWLIYFIIISHNFFVSFAAAYKRMVETHTHFLFYFQYNFCFFFASSHMYVYIYYFFLLVFECVCYVMAFIMLLHYLFCCIIIYYYYNLIF